MEEGKEQEKEIKVPKGKWYAIVGISCVFFIALLIVQYFYQKEKSEVIPVKVGTSEIVDGIHQPTGFIVGEGMQETITNCTSCHSAKLVIQNRMSKEGWTNTIRWMQETQNLWDLGTNEEIITSYLAKHYAPQDTGRRKALSDIEWYNLDSLP